MPRDASDMTINVRPALELGVNLDQYFGLWCVEGARFTALCEQARSLDLRAHITATRSDKDTLESVSRAHAATIAAPTAANPDAAVSMIDLQGTLTKAGSSMSDAGSTVRIRQAVRAAANDPNVSAIVLRIDSPGGTVAGTADLAAEVSAAARRKPVLAFVEDLAASAAYWVASQATKVYANTATALIGSIGTYAVLYDMSGMLAKDGIKVHVVKTGAFKGAGVPGSEITAEQLAAFQTQIDKTQAEFSAAVARGRSLAADAVAKLADGRVHLAADALAQGLIDGVKAFDAVLAEAVTLAQSFRPATQTPRAEAPPPGPSGQATGAETVKEPAMSESSTPKPATLAELEAACKGAPSDFILAQLRAGATATDAVAAHNDLLKAELAAKDKQLEEAKTAAAAKPAHGVKGLSEKPADGKAPKTGGSAMADFKAVVDEHIKSGMGRSQAWGKAIAENPDLHQAYLAEYNAAADRGERPGSRYGG